ncbi:hypothetical protein HU200_040535 [Digitaria exilis]|uniref:Uncharacterized protein n=1 Tax=Digitaria exilis TaxID=1010633 RepID=A0A835EEM4_9POAL|nr:hypothetical protein HU200_040535 [Digitaria exilis]
MPQLFNTVMHTASWELQEFVPVESKMVCVLAMLCWSVMYYCLMRITFQSVIVISDGLPYFLPYLFSGSIFVILHLHLYLMCNCASICTST